MCQALAEGTKAEQRRLHKKNRKIVMLDVDEIMNVSSTFELAVPEMGLFLDEIGSDVDTD